LCSTQISEQEACKVSTEQLLGECFLLFVVAGAAVAVFAFFWPEMCSVLGGKAIYFTTNFTSMQ
jgi:hypothetical protein